MALREKATPEPVPASHVHVSGRAVGAAVNALRRLGLDTYPFLEEAGLEPDDLADPDDRLPYEKLLLVWVSALRASGDPYLGLHASQEIESTDYEILGYLVQTSASVAELLAALHRYQRLLADAIEIDVSLEGESIRIAYRAPTGYQLPRPVAEYVVGVLVKLVRWLIEDDAEILEIAFQHPEPDEPEHASQLLGAPVHYGADVTSLLVRAPLDRPIRTADSELHGILRRQADRLVAETGGDPFVRQVTEVVERALLAASSEAAKEGPATLEIDAIAQRVEVTPRSLKRRLAENGTSVSEITDSLRRELAIHHLASSTLSVGEIGFLVGFSEPSAFHRAFRRWTNHTPSHFRPVGRS